MKYIPIIFTLFLFSCSGTRPTNLGVRNGKLAEIADSPNCVSTQTAQKDKKMNAISYTNSLDYVHQQVLSAIHAFDGDKEIVENDSTYIYAEFTTGMGWVDDVEFYIDTEHQQIEFRSASRIGYSDFGTNRERMENLSKAIRKLLE